MFENVLVGVDGADGGHDALALATLLMSAGGKLTLLHSYAGPLAPLEAVIPGRVADEERRSAELLERERTGLARDAELISAVAASPARALHEEAEERGCDLLVIGSSSRGFLGRVMLGDDARHALNGAPCAVAIAARGFAAGSRRLSKLGVGYEGSRESMAALHVAREIAHHRGASIDAMNVVPLPIHFYTGLMPPLIGEELDVMIQKARAELEGLDGVRGHAVCGIAGEELAIFSSGMDLLIVGSRGYGPLRRLIDGSTSLYLERHARSSLLILPRSAASAEEPTAEESASRERGMSVA